MTAHDERMGFLLLGIRNGMNGGRIDNLTGANEDAYNIGTSVGHKMEMAMTKILTDAAEELGYKILPLN